jgi:acyl carrier protein
LADPKGTVLVVDSQRQLLRSYVIDELIQVPDPAGWDDDGDLLEAGLDSMGIMRLVVFIEERFGVTVPDEEITPENIGSLSAVARLIERHR